MTALIQTVDTPDGPFTILSDAEHRVLASGWTADRAAILHRLAERHRPTEIADGCTAAAEAVAAYYAGDLAAIDAVEVRQHGTGMQTAGWAALRRIAPGEPLTYTAFAVALGSPGAVRPAASICARNAPALFVPCHRVLRTDGTLGGFAWGLDVKRCLLEREAGAAPPDAAAASAASSAAAEAPRPGEGGCRDRGGADGAERRGLRRAGADPFRKDACTQRAPRHMLEGCRVSRPTAAEPRRTSCPRSALHRRSRFRRSLFLRPRTDRPAPRRLLRSACQTLLPPNRRHRTDVSHAHFSSPAIRHPLRNP